MSPGGTSSPSRRPGPGAAGCLRPSRRPAGRPPSPRRRPCRRTRGGWPARTRPPPDRGPDLLGGELARARRPGRPNLVRRAGPGPARRTRIRGVSPTRCRVGQVGRQPAHRLEQVDDALVRQPVAHRQQRSPATAPQVASGGRACAGATSRPGGTTRSLARAPPRPRAGRRAGHSQQSPPPHDGRPADPAPPEPGCATGRGPIPPGGWCAIPTTGTRGRRNGQPWRKEGRGDAVDQQDVGPLPVHLCQHRRARPARLAGTARAERRRTRTRAPWRGASDGDAPVVEVAAGQRARVAERHQ